ncbi:MAG: efflux RND transporter permease subunit [Acidobacteriota bacterium]
MTHGHSSADLIRTTHNTARFFTENRHISWVLLIAVLAWGVFGYLQMPKRKDPDIPVIFAAAICAWPGASAERVEQMVTRRIEERMAENPRVQKIESISRSSVSIVLIALDERTKGSDTGKEYDDISLRLSTIRDLPAGAGPIEFVKDFGDTAALMLTVTSPKVAGVELSLRARSVRTAIEATRGRAAAGARATLIVAYPDSIDASIPRRQRDLILQYMQQRAFGTDHRPVDGAGFVGIDLIAPGDDAAVLGFLRGALENRLVPADFHPDVWDPTIIRDPAQAEARLALVAGDKYSYRELDVYTELIKRVLQSVPQVSKIFRAGLLPEQIFLEYSQERLGATGIQLTRLAEVLGGRNVVLPGGVIDVAGKTLTVDPSGEFKSEKELGNVIVGVSANNRPLYLRDGMEISRGYQTPPQYLNFYDWKDEHGAWQRSRAITLAVQMRPGEQIGQFGTHVNAALDSLRGQLPADLILARPSDQPLQVAENIDLFMNSLYEAIVLVVLVALIGFWEWRSALVMAIAIPVTLAMTFGMMDLLGIDVQQVSIASLIIALGLLVDDPVVAGDAIKRELEDGQPPIIAAWLGPTKLATAIMFATITNIVAYLPLLMVQGATGNFIYSLPIVLACSLIASRLTSMTFIPLLGYYLLRPSRHPEPSIEERRSRGFTGAYYRLGGWALEHRWVTLGIAMLVLVAGGLAVTGLKVQFFPKDLSYLSYVDVWLPEDSTIAGTSATAARAEGIIQEVAAEYGREHPRKDGAPEQVLKSVTTFVGGGGPRFWFSVSPELLQPNYAQLIINVFDKHDTEHLIAPLQRALSAGVPGARVDVRQLETGKPVGIPVSVRISGQDIGELRRLAAEAKAVFEAVPTADRVRDDWGSESFQVKLRVDSDRANFAGVSNTEVALSSVAGVNGIPVTTLREGNQQIPVVARLRVDERARLSDLKNLYVYSTSSAQRVPLGQVSTIQYAMDVEKIRRRNQFRTITVATFPVPGVLPSEVLAEARQGLTAMAATLPPGYRMEIGGEEEEQVKGFKELAVVMLVSVGAIFLALVFQFRNAFKPLIVFAAIPFGVVGALFSLVIMGAPFGFMAFLGVASLIGVIVSHVIVLFDFIEEMHAKGEPLRDALLDAGIVRLRPVLITVGATVFGLIPLALHGGPLWEGLCYTQIGGLTFATVITLVLVPVLYAVFVLDLKIVTWDAAAAHPGGSGAGAAAPVSVS